MSAISSVAVVGKGRMGAALAGALRQAGVTVTGPLGRHATGDGAPVVLLCVPDREIASAASCIDRASLVGHVSASAPLAVLGEREGFSLHPLLSVVGEGASFAGASCAIAGTSPGALGIARELAGRLGMRAWEIHDSQRALYHAAASAASNFLVTLERMAEQLAEAVGLERDALVPLVQGTVRNWAELGAARALTGPIARGDRATADAQRDAVSSAAPGLLPLWDALATATASLAAAAKVPS